MNASPSTPAGSSRLGPQNPWPGLSSFDEADRPYFRGRDAEADELARLVRRERLTVLFGRSGLGKSSLLGAGLFPRLRQDQHLPVLLRIGYGDGPSPRAQVWQALQQACALADIKAEAPLADESLWAYFHRAGAELWTARNRIVLPVLVFDQFEELFTVGQTDEASRHRAAEFLDELAGLIEDRPSEALRAAMDADPVLAGRVDFSRRGCKVVLSFREDFLAEVEALRLRMPSIMRNRFRLTPMNAAQARAVIASGADLVEPEQAPRILGLAWNNRARAPSAADEERLEVDPALLSVICSELNLRRQAAGAARIGASLLEGAEREILDDFYERALHGLDPAVRVFIEDELITQAGYRDSHAYEDALQLPGLSRAAIDRLVDTRLLRVDDRFGVRRLELTHDVLTRVVRDSRDARKAREAEAAALQRERAAAVVQRRNRRHTAWVVMGASAALALLGLAVRQSIGAHESRGLAEEAGALARKAEDRAVLQQLELKKLQSTATDLAVSAAAAQSTAQQASQQASQAVAAAEVLTERAAALQRDAQASDLIVRARSLPPRNVDLALLLGVEALRQYPQRLETRIELLGRVTSQSALQRLLRLDSAATSSASSPDGRWLAVGTQAGEVSLIDTATWQVARSWKGFERSVAALTITADASRVAAVGGGELIVWGVDAGRALARVPWRGTPEALALSPDGAFLAVADQASVKMLNISAAGPIQDMPTIVSLRATRCLAFSRDSTRLLMVASGAVALWEKDGGAAKIRTLPSVKAYSADCSNAAVLTKHDGKSFDLHVHRTQDGTLLGSIPGVLGDADLAGVAFSARGDRVAVRAAALQVWTVSPVVRLSEIQQGTGRVRAVSFSPNGEWLASVQGSDHRVEVHDLQRGELALVVQYARQPRGVFFSPTGSSVLALVPSERRVLQAWALQRGTRLLKDGKPYQASEVEFNRTGSALATAGDGAQFWDARSGALQSEHQQMTRTEFSPDGTRVAVQTDDRTVAVYEAQGTGAALTTKSVAAGRSVEALALSWNRRSLALALDDGTVALYPLQPHGDPLILRSGSAAVRALVFSPGDRWLATGDELGKVRVFDLSGASMARAMRSSHSGGRVGRLVFSPDSRTLASGGQRDGTALLHDVHSGEALAQLPFNADSSASSLVFLHQGRTLAAGSSKGARVIWDLTRMQELTTLGVNKGLREESDPLPVSGLATDLAATTVELSPDGDRAALLHEDGTVSLRRWDAATLTRDACTLANRNLSCLEWRQAFPGQSYRRTCSNAPAPLCTSGPQRN